jgi:similar to stage IV sporulation protein
MQKWLFGLARIKIEGLNLDKIFKKVKHKNVEIKNIKRPDRKLMFFTVKAKEAKIVFNLLKENSYNVKIEKYYGIPYIWEFFKKRIGLFVGAFLFIVTTLFVNSFVWKIEVYGLENLTKQQIISTLEEVGVNVGARVDAKNIEIIENYLSQNLEEISMVSVIKKGASIIVNLKEIRVPDVIANLGAESHLIASYDGVVTKINVVQGTALVEEGSIVKKGETLIAGYFNNIDGTKTPCVAMGEVYAKVWFSSSVNFNTNKTENVRTGEKLVSSSLSLFNSSFKIKQINNTFENYEIEESSQFLFKNNLIPFKINKIIYYETERVLIQQNFEDNKNNLINEALILAREKMPNNFTSNKEFTTIEKNGNIYTVSAFIECVTIIQVVKT